MSFEKIERVDQSPSLNQVPVPTVTGDHSSSRIAKDNDRDGFMSLDELRIKHKLENQVPKGADLDGDGIVSMREAVLTSSNSADPNIGIDEARDALDAVVKSLAGYQSSSASQYTEYLSDMVNSLGVSRSNLDQLLDKVENETDLSILA
jgi:hypothetical protein